MAVVVVRLLLLLIGGIVVVVVVVLVVVGVFVWNEVLYYCALFLRGSWGPNLVIRLMVSLQSQS